MSAPTEDVAALAPRVRVPGAVLLDWFERVGNRFPDPIILFLAALGATWAASSLLAGRDFGLIDPRTRAALQIHDQLTLQALATFMVGVTHAFVTFPPFGMVLVMVIGVAVAERSGLVGGALRGVLSVAAPRLLTPLVATAAIAAHVMSDGAVIIVVPLAGALFFVAGRHPLAGILAGFAPLSGAMFANLFPYALDAIVAGFSETGARLIAPAYRVNPLSNYRLAIATATAVAPLTWWLVDRVAEPRLIGVAVDGDPALMPTAPPLTRREWRGLWIASAVALALAGAFGWVVAPQVSPMRAPDGTLTGPGSPLMQGLIPLMPYFPLVLSFCRRYVTGFGVGSLMSLLLPFGTLYLVLQVGMLLAWWAFGLPLGIGGRYAVP